MPLCVKPKSRLSSKNDNSSDFASTPSSDAVEFSNEDQDKNIFSDYIIDIWYLISEYILPEDVCRFALKCRKTAEVVQSAKFWYHLYRKHCNVYVDDLPGRLQSVNMIILHGLRACTIRCLFYTYPPFVHRITIAPYTDPHRITGRQLVFSWYRQYRTGWNYYFKLRSRPIPGSRAERSTVLQRQKTYPDYLKDIFMNPEEGCQILIVTTEALHIIPQYQEPLFVRSLTQTLAQGMSKYMVRLKMANYCQQVVDEIVLVPVRRVRLLDWWNPNYYLEGSTMEREETEQEQTFEGADARYWDD
ncbi:transmembrane protein 183-like isoform X1 [Wyeomyia smithii]|uniref:transmembrane protein 183-like isoform X1 n=1 Tax=Wyeomyia smithii TaxID=174621 RepID=UPI002467EAAA|nr:transmembrane protein 183-like isoform X1 [Wyeomyia smithii]